MKVKIISRITRITDDPRVGFEYLLQLQKKLELQRIKRGYCEGYLLQKK